MESSKTIADPYKTVACQILTRYFHHRDPDILVNDIEAALLAAMEHGEKTYKKDIISRAESMLQSNTFENFKL